MDTGDTIFLAMSIAVFIIFALVLAWVSNNWTIK